MANYKRGKSRRQVRCTLCTPHKWLGNNKPRKKDPERALRKEMDREIKEHAGVVQR